MTDSTTGPEADARRAALLARIAKHNGLTPEQAAALSAMNDINPAAGEDSHDVMAERAAVKSSAQNAPQAESNPFTTALLTIGIIGAVLGAIVYGVGFNNAANYSPSLYSSHNDSGVGELAIGNVLFNLGTIAFLLLITARAVIWALDRKSQATG